MSSFYPNVSPNYVFPRNPDQYIFLKQTKIVKYSKITLKEIPSHTHSLIVKKQDGTIMNRVDNDPSSTNQFRVDFVTGDVSFHSSMENQEIEISYTGTGQVNFGANKIIVNTSPTNEEEVTIQDILDTQEDIYTQVTDVKTTIEQNQIVKLDDFNYLKDTTYLSPKEFTWVSTANQDTFAINNGIFTEKSLIDLSIGNVPQSSDNFTLVNNTTIKLPTPLPSNIKVYVKWSEGKKVVNNSVDITDVYSEINGTKNSIVQVNEQLATKEKQIEILTNNKFRMTFRNDQLGVNIQNPTELSVLQSKFVKMKEIGIHNIILCPQVNMLTYQSNDFTEDTISYEQIKTNAETCIAAGFNVYLKLHVECKDGTWRANIAPTDINTFFTNYKNFILKYAQLSEELGLKFFCIGEEMMSISGSNYSDKWSDIINSIRTIYNGKLTYGANLIVWDDEHRRNIIYDLVDYLGIDLWAQAASGANPSNLNIYQQINGWLIPTFEELYTTYGKKIIFTEIGYFPTSYGAEQPGNTSQPDWTINYQQQANIYNMIFSNFIGQDWFQDLWYWCEKNTSYSNGTGNLDRYSVLIDGNVATQNIFKKFKEV